MEDLGLRWVWRTLVEDSVVWRTQCMDDSVVRSSAESMCGIRCFCPAQALFWPHTLWTGLGLGIQQPTSGGPAAPCPVEPGRDPAHLQNLYCTFTTLQPPPQHCRGFCCPVGAGQSQAHRV